MRDARSAHDRDGITPQRARLGEQVRAARIALGYSQDQLADLAGVAPNTLGAIERGRSVQGRNLRKVVERLGLTLAADDAADNAASRALVERVSMWLDGMPAPERLAAVLYLTDAMGRYRT